MNLPKSDEYDYINFLIATPKVFSRTEAERVQPDAENSPSYDAVTRFLRRSGDDSSFLRNESSGFADLKRGISVSDDSAPCKPYAGKTEPVCHRRYGKHHRAVRGINLLTMLRTDGDAHIPCDYRIYDMIEIFSLKTGYSRFEAEMRIIRDDVRAYLKNPLYVLQPTA
ncbi:MAG TPA: hypothetical protein DCQ37_12300 [Desulfobacteraceae bacterium]|nr:hypothetical protein [Desulfobacteraceae bacterium]